MKFFSEDALVFLLKYYPNEAWKYQGLVDGYFFFNNEVEEEKKAAKKKKKVNNENYKQFYIVNKKTGLEIIHDEDNGFSSPYKKPYDLVTDLDNVTSSNKVGVINSVGFDQYYYRYFGSSNSEYVKKFIRNKSDHFLQIIQDGMDLSLPKGKRSTFDLCKKVDLDKLVKEVHNKNENLLLNYINYMDHHICTLLNEDKIAYNSIMNENYNDSVADMLVVFNKIQEANEKAGYKVKVNSKSVKNIVENLKDLKGYMEFSEQDYTKKQYKEIDKVFSQLKKEIKKYV